jgi:hypothetical protein
MNDVIIVIKIPEEHLDHLKTAFQKFEEAGFKPRLFENAV